jgi:hypothetical protein
MKDSKRKKKNKEPKPINLDSNFNPKIAEDLMSNLLNSPPVKEKK